MIEDCAIISWKGLLVASLRPCLSILEKLKLGGLKGRMIEEYAMVSRKGLLVTSLRFYLLVLVKFEEVEAWQAFMGVRHKIFPSFPSVRSSLKLNHIGVGGKQ